MNDNYILKLLFHGYEDINELSDNELETLISEILNIEEVPIALVELYTRKPNVAFDLGKNIVEKEEGDEYLQGAIIDIIFEYDSDYVIGFVKKSISKINYYVYGCILDSLAVESKQQIGKQLSRDFLQRLVNKYNDYTASEKSKIAEKYNFFVESYSSILEEKGVEELNYNLLK